MVAPGRSCPIGYRYAPESIGATQPIVADVLYVVGGLYGNPFALDTVFDAAAREAGRVAIIFSGDFHWFDAEVTLFSRIDHAVMANHALRGNVETELALPSGEAGCGCAYPDWVGEGEVERSNAILRRLSEVAAKTHDNLRRYANLPMHAGARVGGVRVAIVHGDGASLSGWTFAQENLRNGADAASVMLGRINADIIASTHTCLPIARRFATPQGERWLFNNGAAGMPNFQGDLRGLCTRIAHAPSGRALYGAKVNDVVVEAIPLELGGDAWVRQFDTIWSEFSPAAVSYRQRITQGTRYEFAQALGEGIHILR